MNSRQVAAFGVAAVVALHGAAAQAQGVEIDHKAVGCIVVGKYPKLDACFTPAANLARSRVYFRPEGTPSWYYVDMKAAQPCFSGVLPRPGKKLVGKKIEYYVDAQDKTFNSARTAEFSPIVVNSAQECKKDVPAAPFLNAANVAVFPALPAGFVGGTALGTGAILGIVGAGAAAAGTAVVVSNNNNNDNTTTTLSAVGGVTTTTVSSVTPTTTTTTLPNNQPPNGIFEAKPTSGTVPLNVHFDMCKTTDPDNDALQFKFDFGDGSSVPYGPQCFADHTYPNASSTKAVRAQAKDFAANLCVTDNHFERCRSITVSANTKCELDKEDPGIDITNPADGSVYNNISSIDVTVHTNDDTGVRRVDYTLSSQESCAYSYSVFAKGAGFTQEEQRGTNAFPYGVNFDLPAPGCLPGSKTYRIDATITDVCDKTSTVSSTFTVMYSSPPSTTFGCPSCARAGSSGRHRSAPAAGRRIVWTSELSLDGRGQVVVNGSSGFSPGKGRSFAVTPVANGENRVEATLVDGSGKAGTWRFELGGADVIAAGSLRVVAGDVALITENTVVFRLTGAPGERVVFVFQKK